MNEKKEYEKERNDEAKESYILTAGDGEMGEKGPTGDVGVAEALGDNYREDEEKADRYELASRNPSDLNDPGDPEAQDVGLVGGAGAGGEISGGGTGGFEDGKEDVSDLVD